MTKKTLSIDSVGKPDNPYENLPVIPRDEALRYIAEEATRRAHMRWGEAGTPNKRILVEDRINGVIHTVFELLQNGDQRLPPMALVPQLDKEYSFNVLPRDETGNYVWKDIETTMTQHRWDAQPIPLQGNDIQPSFLKIHADTYDLIRSRFAAAARDLFNYGDEIK